MDDNINYITPKEAVDLADKAGIGANMATVYTWSRKYGLGKKVGGRWFIDGNLFDKFLRGEINEENETCPNTVPATR